MAAIHVPSRYETVQYAAPATLPQPGAHEWAGGYVPCPALPAGNHTVFAAVAEPGPYGPHEPHGLDCGASMLMALDRKIR